MMAHLHCNRRKKVMDGVVTHYYTLVHCRYYNIKIQPQSNINDDFPVPHPHPIPLKSGPRTTSDNSSFMEPRKFVKIISLLSPIKLSGLLASQLCLPLWMRSFAAVWNFPLLLIKYIRAKSESLILGWLTNYGLVFGAGHLALLTPTLNQC